MIAERQPLRDRLLSLRNDTLRQLDGADVLDGGLLRLLGDANAALAALDRHPPADTEPAARAVVSDDGIEIGLISYTQAGAAAMVVLDPRRAIALAGQLIAAALRYSTAGQ
jgi:hypothetical protein